MPRAAHPFDEALGRLNEAAHVLEPHHLARAAGRVARHIGASDLTLYMVGYEQYQLMPILAEGSFEQLEPLDIDTTMAGRCYINGTVVDAAPPDGGSGDARQVWFPLLDGAERLGVMSVIVEQLDDDTIQRGHFLATTVSHIMVSKQTTTDLYHVRRRRTEMTLAAEMHWRLIPPLTFESDRVAVAGVLEPAHEIGGDAFDYSLNEDVAHVAIIDAMGHGLTATLPAAVCLGSFRHSRRHGLTLEETYTAATVALEHFAADLFVTAQLATLDLAGGHLRLLNAGHPPPLLVRGGRVVGEVRCPPSLPVGLAEDVTDVVETQLEPGDRLLFFTDGVVEGHEPGGEIFGVDRLSDVLSRVTLAGYGPAETLRRLSHAVLRHVDHHLQDDFTMLFLEYRGPDITEVERIMSGEEAPTLSDRGRRP